MSPRRRLVFRPGARAEIREARGWYEARLAGLGRRFLADLDATMAHVVEHPEMYQALAEGSGDRRALLRRFPYSVVTARRTPRSSCSRASIIARTWTCGDRLRADA